MRVVKSSFLAIVIFLLFSGNVSAQVVSIKPGGEIIWNVLSDETSVTLDLPLSSSLEIKKAGDEKVEANPTVTLTKMDGKINLQVESGNGTRGLDVIADNKNLIEIEERPNIQKITVGVRSDKFVLTQRSISALTEYPVQIDSASAKFSLETPGGQEYLSIFPYDAVSSALRSRLMSRVDGDLEILEQDGKSSYKITGAKVFNFFDLYKYSIPITAYVSTSTGELVSIDSPTWFRVIKFLFI